MSLVVVDFRILENYEYYIFFSLVVLLFFMKIIIVVELI